MTNFLQMLLALSLIFTLSGCQEWYIPDSNLISDKQFQQKIIDDKHSFKFVKYFTPHCPYCRYLKAVVDKLKHSKEWCFKIYDFNCQWYPQFCMTNVHSGSFPYTAIYNQNGDLDEQIHGFYPQPIISTIFNRIQQKCLALRTATNSIPPVVVSQAAHQEHQQKVQIAPPEHAQASEQHNNKIVPSEATQQQQQHQQHQQQTTNHQSEEIKTVTIKQEHQKVTQTHHQEHAKNQQNQQSLKNDVKSLHQTETKPQNPKTEKVIQNPKTGAHNQHLSNKQIPKQVKESNLHQPESSHHTNSQHISENQNVASEGDHQNKSSFHHGNYIFYAVCIIFAGCYVYNLHTDKQNPQVIQDSYQKGKNNSDNRQELPPATKNENASLAATTVEQSELLNLPDQAL